VIASETCAFPNLGYKIHEHLEYYEIVSIDESGVKKRGKASGKKIFCSFLPVYYGFPSSSYYGINSEVVRERCGGFLAETDDINPDYVAGIQDSGTPHAIGYCKRKIEIFAEKFEKIKQLMESEVDSNELKSLINNLEKPPSFGLPLVKYNASWSRSYIPPTKALRELIANFKQVSIAEKIKDSRIVVVDDSIRKGKSDA
jgi:amidophosphoribosyltransferase